MKFKRTVILATFVVTMGLLLGTSAAQEPNVIFENGTFKAIGIENLNVEGTFYNVKFTSTGTVAPMVYGIYPGVFDFSEATTAVAAVDAVVFELNRAGATGVGAEGSVAVPFFWVGFDSEKGVDPQIEVVFLLESLYGEAQEGVNLWFAGSDIKSELYNFGTGVWAKFTEASKDLQVIFEGNTATGIRNLEVDGQLYDVEFRFDTAENIYGEDPIFDFGVNDVSKARRAVEDALNSEPAVKRVGPVPDNAYSIGFSKWFFSFFGYIAITLDAYDIPTGPWAPIRPYSIGSLGVEFTWADFTPVNGPTAD